MYEVHHPTKFLPTQLELSVVVKPVVRVLVTLVVVVETELVDVSGSDRQNSIKTFNAWIF